MEKKFDSMDMSVFDAYGILKLKDERIIYINGVITDKLSVVFNLAILEFAHENPEADISVYINQYCSSTASFP